MFTILFACSEVAPWAKTGGLGDVAASLPAALRARGHSISIVVPLYACLKETRTGLRPTHLLLEAPYAGQPLPGRIWQGRTEAGVPLFAVERDEFFDRSAFYGSELGDYFDNLDRFTWFCRMAVALAQRIRPVPSIIHANDWQTALIPAILRSLASPIRSVLTLHNLAFQGSFPASEFFRTGLPPEFFSPQGLEFFGRLNLLKGGILLAHRVTTVSPTYAREIQTAQFGCGLDGVLREQSYKLHGVLNGMDTVRWNPATDPHLPARYHASDLKGKALCKRALLERAGWKPGSRRPLFGVVSRLSSQKGWELILAVLDEIAALKSRLIVLGDGDPALRTRLAQEAAARPDHLWFHAGFDETLAHLIEAGADFFLMPSAFEPCGLNQLYSQRYGTPPIVHRTGGLADTVQDWNPHTQEGTGFVFERFEPQALITQLRRAVEVYQDRDAFTRLRLQGMSQDFSWQRSVSHYEHVYQRALI